MDKKIIIQVEKSYYVFIKGKKELERRESWIFENDRIQFNVYIPGIGSGNSNKMWHEFYKHVADAIERYYNHLVFNGYYHTMLEFKDTIVYRIYEDIFIPQKYEKYVSY